MLASFMFSVLASLPAALLALPFQERRPDPARQSKANNVTAFDHCPDTDLI